ncbi:MAG: thiol-disulfide oxidoreductase DCC family protein [Chitinophagaceae bacterium]|nr:MAG: thiol-disulfide oxidoreductase DCC family protein [Chitinophagaceae bacterium]
MNNNPVILFDGTCNFCNFWIQFVIKRDRKRVLKFAPLQGESAKKLLLPFGINPTNPSSVLLIDQGKIYTQSSAAFRLFKYLDGGWKLIYGLIIIPKNFRDFFYNIISHNRYRWFGKKDTCIIPNGEMGKRFLD